MPLCFAKKAWIHSHAASRASSAKTGAGSSVSLSKASRTLIRTGLLGFGVPIDVAVTTDSVFQDTSTSANFSCNDEFPRISPAQVSKAYR